MHALARQDTTPHPSPSPGSPLAHAGWLAFNRETWGVTPKVVRLTGDGAPLPAINAVYYLDRKGRIVIPRLNPYLPVSFTSTPTQGRARLDRQWLEASGWLAAEMRTQGLRGAIALPPEVADIRPWQWAGFRANVRYTFVIDLHTLAEHQDSMVRNRIATARRRGYRSEPTDRLGDVWACLLATQERQGFGHGLSLRDLERAREYLGPERFRCYLCRAADGEPASAFIALYEPGGEAIGWVAGTRLGDLAAGAAQLTMHDALVDLAAAGARKLDWAGANLATIAAAKASWGPRLVPYFLVEAPTTRGIAKYLRDAWRYHASR